MRTLSLPSDSGMDLDRDGISILDASGNACGSRRAASAGVVCQARIGRSSGISMVIVEQSTEAARAQDSAAIGGIIGTWLDEFVAKRLMGSLA